MVSQCSICSRMFEVSELYKKMVDAGKITPECGDHDGSHDDGAIIPEIETIEDEQKHDQEIESEYRYGDR